MTTPGGELVRRDDVVSGSIQSQRRAARVLGRIEARVIHMRDETRRAIDAFFFGGSSDYQRKVDRGYLASVLTLTRAGEDVSLRDFERFAPQWRSLVPADPRIRADLLQRLVQRFDGDLAGAPATLEAAGASSASVLEAYAEAFGSEFVLPESPAVQPRADSADPQESAEWLRISGGEEIYREGDAADALFLVVNGHLRLLSGEPGVETVEWEYGRGGVVGEAEVLTGEPRMGRLVALRDTELVRVPQEAVLALGRARPETLFRMNRTLVERLRGRSAATKRAASTFALLPAHDGAPLRMIADSLLATFRRFGSAGHVDRQALDDHLRDGFGIDEAAYEAEVIAWLSEKESAHDYIIAEAERDPRSEWSQRCQRQADQVVLVADASELPDLAALEGVLARTTGRPDLILVQAAGAQRPRNTRPWLRALRPRFVYHWRQGDDDQAAHVARRMLQKAVAVVFSGGAARGYAHIGAMQALAERGIPVDLIAGTSMGAMVGGGFALGRDAEAMRRHAISTATRRKLLDPTLPLAAFTSGRKVTQLLKREAEGERIEDLWRPYFCISANITRASAQVHAEGPLWHAIRASIAIPGVIPPVLAPNGDVLVDGNAINNMPIDLVRQREDIATIFAVNVAPIRDRAESYKFGSSVSGWRTLVELLRYRGISSVPGLFSTVMRANEVRGAAQMRSSAFTDLADLVIEPPVEQFPLLQFSQCPAIIECGYRSAGEALDRWLAGPGGGLFNRLGVMGEMR